MLRRLLLPLTLLLCAPSLYGQANVCTLVEQQGPYQIQQAGDGQIIYASGPLFVRCQNGEELRADSAVLYSANNEVHLFRRVDYGDPTRALTSDYATYNGTTGRLYATGNVVFTDKQRGSTLRGPDLEYFRVIPGRPEAQMIATGRPHLTVVPRSEPGQARRDPMEIDGDRITSIGERFLSAEGNAVIRGRQVNASAATATFDQEAERLELRSNARIQGERYDLSGDFIETQLREGSVERVLSRTNARLVNERLTVNGPELQLFFAGDSLQRLVSGPGGQTGERSRSVALATGFRMEGDSLEAQLPGQLLQRVAAVGTARAEAWDTAQATPPPTTAAPLDSGVVRPTVGAAGDSAAQANADADGAEAVVPRDRDLIFADTIIGYFVQVDTTTRASAADSVRRTEPKTELDRMLAMGEARSLYRLRNREQERGTATEPPGINYVIGDTIDLRFADGEVDVAQVRGLDRGVYLDPVPPGQPQGGGTEQPTTPAVSGRAATVGGRPAPGGRP